MQANGNPPAHAIVPHRRRRRPPADPLTEKEEATDILLRYACVLLLQMQPLTSFAPERRIPFSPIMFIPIGKSPSVPRASPSFSLVNEVPGDNE